MKTPLIGVKQNSPFWNFFANIFLLIGILGLLIFCTVPLDKSKIQSKFPRVKENPIGIFKIHSDDVWIPGHGWEQKGGPLDEDEQEANRDRPVGKKWVKGRGWSREDSWAYQQDQEAKRKIKKDNFGNDMVWITGRGWSTKNGWAHTEDENAKKEVRRDNYGNKMVWITGRGWSTKGGYADLTQRNTLSETPKDIEGRKMKWVAGHGWEPKDSSYNADYR